MHKGSNASKIKSKYNTARKFGTEFFVWLFSYLRGRIDNGTETLRIRWDRQLLPWLTQHYAGTTGFRIERMLTRLVADKFTDHRGIDWTEILDQHREFLGHTCTSLSRTFTRVLNSAKKDKCGAVSLLHHICLSLYYSRHV